MQLHQLFYVSRATPKMSADVQNIINTAHARNGPLHVTGAFVFSGEFFAQVLEGPPQALETLMCSIRRDPRHTIMWEWPSRPVAERWYPHWSMGYLQNDNLEAVVDHLSQSPGSLPPIDDFVRWLVSTSRLDKNSRTASLPPA